VLLETAAPIAHVTCKFCGTPIDLAPIVVFKAGRGASFCKWKCVEEYAKGQQV
jgi:hypothetical protein